MSAVLSGCLVGVDPGGWDEPWHGVVVDDVVVVCAQQGQVADGGMAAVGPVCAVVVAPGCGPVAAGEGAALVAGDQGAADRGGDDAGGRADVEWFPAPAKHDGDHVRVAQHAAGRFDGDRDAGVKGSWRVPGRPGRGGLQAFPAHGQRNVGSFPAYLRQLRSR